MINGKISDKIGKALFIAAAVVTTVSVAAIFAFLIIKSAPAFNKIGFFDFLFGSEWVPDANDGYEGEISGTYGIFKMVVGTLAATSGALLVGGILGYFTAVFIAFYCPKRLKRPLFSVINLLAGIPSVIYGFFGIVFLLPALASIAPNNGSGLLATSIILGIMILPTVVSLSKTSLEAVPASYYDGAVALGAPKSEAIFKVVSPAAKSGITASLVLGTGRALGETMAVVMVAGNAVRYPKDLFTPFRAMTANVVLEMGYAGELQEGALIATGVVLLAFVLIINLLFSAVSGKTVAAVTVKKKNHGVFQEKTAKLLSPLKDFSSSLGYKLKLPLIFKILSCVSGVLACAALAGVISFILIKGLPPLIGDPALMWRKFEFGSLKITIFPSIVTTLITVVLSIVISVPVGIMTAIYLNEYAKKENFFVKAVRTAINVLSGVPSIVYGLFGMITFVPLFSKSHTSSIIAGVATISIMLLPTVIRSVEESLKSVDDSLREGSYALGAGKLRTIMKIILPSAMPGIISAIILSMGRVVSESAPFLYTAGSVIKATPEKLTDSNATLSVALYQLSGEGWYVKEAYATAVVLIILVLILNLAAETAAEKLNKKLSGKKK